MIHNHIYKSRVCLSKQYESSTIHSILESRNLFNIQTIQYELMAACSMDLDPTENFLLIGLSNGIVDLQGIQDPTYGTLDEISRLHLSTTNIHRVQWNPGSEQFFSLLDNHNLHLVDPVVGRPIEKFHFELKTLWSEWNPNDRKVIAVCGTESQTRLVDIRSGSAAQTVILGAPSGLSTHRASRCLWSKRDQYCLIVGDNEGYIHAYDTRRLTRPHILVGEEERGQITGMAFTNDQNSILTTHGSDNHLIQWHYNKKSLESVPGKFRKPPKIDPMAPAQPDDTQPGASRRGRGVKRKNLPQTREPRRHLGVKPIEAYYRCQFYVTDKHVFCPVSYGVKKSKEIYIYDIDSGLRIKTLKSDDILSQGVYTVHGLMPDSLVLYVGGRNRLRVWTLDEDYQRKMEEKIAKYHRTQWDSDDEA